MLLIAPGVRHPDSLSLPVALVVLAAGIMPPAGFGQTPAANPPPDPSPLPRFAVAGTFGTLGAGIQAATAVARETNIRFGFNYFSLGLSGTHSQTNLSYDATLRLASVEILLDQNLKGPFHVSGGALIYDGFQGTASVGVPAGQSVTLNHFTYYSQASDPVTGSATAATRTVAPEVLIGFGNLLPRGKRHFSANVDFGVAFQGSPDVRLSLTGSTCLTPAAACAPISSNPVVQANIAAQQAIIGNDLKIFRFYPVVRVSLGYKF
jgi:hypothetical protein